MCCVEGGRRGEIATMEQCPRINNTNKDTKVDTEKNKIKRAIALTREGDVSKGLRALIAGGGGG